MGAVAPAPRVAWEPAEPAKRGKGQLARDVGNQPSGRAGGARHRGQRAPPAKALSTAMRG
eukprot:9023180-Lingulodinium_polyedra.AAC.1